jgi:hypothetical protein
MEGKCKGIKRVQSASIMRADVAFLYFEPFFSTPFIVESKFTRSRREFGSKPIEVFEIGISQTMQANGDFTMSNKVILCTFGAFRYNRE